MPTLGADETLTVLGTVDMTNGILVLANSQIDRKALETDALDPVGISLTELHIWNDLASFLPSPSGADDLGIVMGTWGTDAPTVQTKDMVNNDAVQTQYCRFRVVLGQEYVAAGGVKLRIRAGMITTISDVPYAMLDVECYADDGDGGVSADLCTTAAQSINSLTKANKEFVITATTLAPGSVLDFRIAIAVRDNEDTGAVIAEISAISLLRDCRG